MNRKLFELKHIGLHKRNLINTKIEICHSFIWFLSSLILNQFTLDKKRKLTPIVLSAEFNQIITRLEHEHLNAFITGRAGTGKSTLLQLFRNTTKKRTVVLAPTGIAALNVKGQTIHSFFRFPPKMINREDIHRRKNNYVFRKVQTIIIDEISMVRADMLDNIDYFLRVNREIDEPFGGVQMIFFGDLFQLPPVISSPVERQYFTTRYESPYFFSSDVVQHDIDLEMIELRKVYRQEQKHFIRILDNIRTMHFDYDDMEELNQRHVPLDEEDEDYYITLTSRNDIANSLNEHELKKIDEDIMFYNAKVTGEFRERLFPTDSTLQLKKGCQVMFIKNDLKKRFVNGTIGKIVSLESDVIKVSIPDPDLGQKIIDVEPLEWEILKYDLNKDVSTGIATRVVGTYTQMPLKLAWAITIHKSQGKTFDRVIIDLGRGAFEYGQTYVALSRCRTLEGIILKNPIKPQDVKVDRRITEYYDQRK